MQHSQAEVNTNTYTILMCQLTLEPLADVTVAHCNKGCLENVRVIVAELTTSNLRLLAIDVSLVVCEVCVCVHVCVSCVEQLKF